MADNKLKKEKPLDVNCQAVLPLVYDDSASYYEVLCKLYDDVTNTIKSIKELIEKYPDISEWSKILNELTSELTQVKKDIRGIENDVSILKNKINTLDTNYNEISEKISLIESDISDLKNSVNKCVKDIRELNESVTSLKSDVESINKNVSELLSCCEKVQSDIKKINDNIDNLTTSINSINELLNETISNVSDMGNNIEKITNRVNSIEINIEELNSTTKDLSNKYNELLTNVDTIETDITGINSQITEINSKIASMQISINSISTISKSVDEINKSLNNINDTLSSLSNDVGNNKTNINTLFNEYNVVIESVKTLGTNLEELKNSVYTKTETDSKLSTKANSADVYTKTQTYTQTEVNNLLGKKANSADVYTKTETDTKLSTKANSADVYTKTEADTKLSTKANSTDVYTKTQIDSILKPITNNVLANKKIIIYGDDNVLYSYKNYNKWSDIFKTQMSQINCSVTIAGSATATMSDAYSYFVNKEIDKSINIVIISVGTYDYYNSKELGSVTDTNYLLFNGALNNLAEALDTNCPNATIYLMTPIKFSRKQSSAISTNYVPFPLYLGCMRRACARFGWELIDTYNTAPLINLINGTKWYDINDTVLHNHPSVDYSPILANLITQYLVSGHGDSCVYATELISGTEMKQMGMLSPNSNYSINIGYCNILANPNGYEMRISFNILNTSSATFATLSKIPLCLTPYLNNIRTVASQTITAGKTYSMYDVVLVSGSDTIFLRGSNKTAVNSLEVTFHIENLWYVTPK